MMPYRSRLVPVTTSSSRPKQIRPSRSRGRPENQRLTRPFSFYSWAEGRTNFISELQPQRELDLAFARRYVSNDPSRAGNVPLRECHQLGFAIGRAVVLPDSLRRRVVASAALRDDCLEVAFQ